MSERHGLSREERQERLLNELRRSQVPLSANTLSKLLDISPRTIRDYVASLNSGAERPLVISDQRGYQLDEYQYHKWRAARVFTRASAADPGTSARTHPDGDDTSGKGTNGEDSAHERAANLDTPRARLNSILRYLSTDGDLNVYELADHFHVSIPTLETDLQRVRTIVRDQGLVLRRNRDVIVLEGTERAKRRLLRSVLFAADGGAALEALIRTRERPESEMAQLSHELTKALSQSGLELNEYVRGELLIHLSVAVERTRTGAAITTPAGTNTTEAADGMDPAISASVRAIVEAVKNVTGASLNTGEQTLLYTMLLANSKPLEASHHVHPDPDILEVTQDSLTAISEQFGVSRNDDRHLIPLALHLQHLRERALLDRQLDSPMGPGFRREHPLLHEMALLFAHALQVRTGLEIGSGEIVYLALHLGAQFQSQLEKGPLVTVTLVAPGYGTLSEVLEDNVRQAIGKQGTLEAVVTDVSADLRDLTSDVVVSTVPSPHNLHIPFVHISPFCTETDATFIRDAIRGEQERQRKDRLRSTLVSLMDPALFLHVDTFASRTMAIETGARMVIDQGLAEEGFSDDVLERERRSSTTFGGRFAIPHSLYQDGLRTGICILTSSRPVEWGGADVNLIFMFVIAPGGMPPFRDALEALVPILSEPENVAQLIGASDHFSTFTDTLLSFLS